MRAMLIGGPLDGDVYEAGGFPHEIFYRAEVEGTTQLELINATNASVSVQVSYRRYIRHLFSVRGVDVYAYVWEYMTPEEALEIIRKLKRSRLK